MQCRRSVETQSFASQLTILGDARHCVSTVQALCSFTPGDSGTGSLIKCLFKAFGCSKEQLHSVILRTLDTTYFARSHLVHLVAL